MATWDALADFEPEMMGRRSLALPWHHHLCSPPAGRAHLTSPGWCPSPHRVERFVRRMVVSPWRCLPPADHPVFVGYARRNVADTTLPCVAMRDE